MSRARAMAHHLSGSSIVATTSPVSEIPARQRVGHREPGVLDQVDLSTERRARGPGRHCELAGGGISFISAIGVPAKRTAGG